MDQLSKILVMMVAGCLFLAGCGAITQRATNPTVGVVAQATPVVGHQDMASPTVAVAAMANSIVGGGAANASVITPDMKDKTLQLKVGDTFEIQIPTIPTAGMNWEAQDLDTTILSQLGDAVYKADTDANSVGGIVTIKFKVVGPGTTPLTLLYVAPPQNGLPSMYKNSFGVTIVAK